MFEAANIREWRGHLPAADEEAIFQHYGLAYERGGGGERLLACR